MGILSSTGAASVTAEPASDSADSDIADSVAGDEAPAEGGQDGEQAAQPETEGEPQPRQSRRNKTAERIDSHFKALREEWSKERETTAQRLQSLAEQNARLHGQLEAFQRQPQPAAQQQAPGPAPAELRRQARAALDGPQPNFSEYERLQAEAFRVEAEQVADAKVKAAIAEMQKNQPAPLPPLISNLLATHKRVAMAGDRGSMVVQGELNFLHAAGAPQTPETLQKAFELAEKRLEAMSKPTGKASFQHDQSAVSGVPTAKGGNGAAGGSDEPALTDIQKRAAVAAGMTPQEYMKWMDPGKAGIRKW
jgi:hypothetical protein